MLTQIQHCNASWTEEDIGNGTNDQVSRRALVSSGRILSIFSNKHRILSENWDKTSCMISNSRLSWHHVECDDRWYSLPCCFDFMLMVESTWQRTVDKLRPRALPILLSRNTIAIWRPAMTISLSYKRWQRFKRNWWDVHWAHGFGNRSPPPEYNPTESLAVFLASNIPDNTPIYVIRATKYPSARLKTMSSTLTDYGRNWNIIIALCDSLELNISEHSICHLSIRIDKRFKRLPLRRRRYYWYARITPYACILVESSEDIMDDNEMYYYDIFPCRRLGRQIAGLSLSLQS